ncbi:MAG: 2-succinyl-5-enolpyruvyl-6-hydroxy-3-cyclohexene-1-carboxylic-acid synthase [Cyanobacteria bacterium P01_A01_bin.84]
MTIGFRNINEVWASILVETWKRLGLTCAIICPGSRSTPLVVAFTQQKPHIEVIPILDERSGAFFALGRAKVTGTPTAIVCTSGTAGANFYPAVIEATESRIPLLILTADRPQELRNCHSGQTINQLRLYGDYPNWQTELAIPSEDMRMLSYLRQTAIHAWERTLHPIGGIVHLNIPFRDPLAPTFDNLAKDTLSLNKLKSQFNTKEFFTNLRCDRPITLSNPTFPVLEWLQTSRGIIIAGVSQPQKPEEYSYAISRLTALLNFPVLAEALSPLRNYAQLNSNIISTYDIILRNPQLATKLKPEIVIQIGEMPTSKILRNWLTATNAQRWIIEPSDQNLDPLHGRTIHIRIGVEEIGEWKFKSENQQENIDKNSPYLQMWRSLHNQVKEKIDVTLAQTTELFEGKVAWLLSQILPPQTSLFISNSMPVRDVEFFWQNNNLGIRAFCNRGANGIDGTLSTALGIAYQQQSSVMLTGDLGLLHDTNGFLIRNKFIGHLTILLINNNGGGIFEMLPISGFEPPFEEYFATPQNINFAQLCTTYGIEHELITSWEQLKNKLNPLPDKGIRILEIPTNRKNDAKWRQENFAKIANEIYQ